MFDWFHENFDLVSDSLEVPQADYFDIEAYYIDTAIEAEAGVDYIDIASEEDYFDIVVAGIDKVIDMKIEAEPGTKVLDKLG